MKTMTSKILAVIALVLGITSVVLVWDAQQTSADILDLATTATHDDTEFVHALKSMGHDRFDLYEVNGQTIHTSVHHFRDASPVSLLQQYQRALVAHGVNDRAYFDHFSGDPEDRLFTGLKGGLVPFKVGERHVAMGGVITAGYSLSDADVIRELSKMPDNPRGFRGHRVIEIMRPVKSNRTTVVATWAEDFDFDSFQPGSEDLSTRQLDEDVPSCPDCTRLHHLNHPRRSPVDKGVHVFMGTRAPSFYRDWYSRNLAADGWKSDQGHNLTARLKALHGPGMPNEWMTFERDGWARSVAIYDLGGGEVGIHVHTEAAPEIDAERNE